MVRFQTLGFENSYNHLANFTKIKQLNYVKNIFRFGKVFYLFFLPFFINGSEIEKKLFERRKESENLWEIWCIRNQSKVNQNHYNLL